LRRGEVWWANLSGPAGRRPVVLLSRDEAYLVRALVTVAPITTRVRGLPIEVALGVEDGLPRSCVANLDTITTIPKDCLSDRVGVLSVGKIRQLDGAIRFALALDI
jgi:mRNA interferase MazF